MLPGCSIHLDFHSPPLTHNQIRHQHDPRALATVHILRLPLGRSLLVMDGSDLLQSCLLDLHAFEVGKKLGWYKA